MTLPPIAKTLARHLGTLRVPDQPTAPAIAPASWFPPSIGTLSELNAPTIVENTVSDSSRDSDLSDLATEDGTYGSGSESCGSKSFPNHFMCAVINAGDTSANRGNNGNTGNGTDPPNATNGGNGGAVNPPSIINEQTGERVVIRLNEQEWERCREALRGAPLPFGSPQELLMGYHWLLKEEIKRQKQAIAQLEARKKAADESSLRRVGLSSYGGSSSRGNEHLARKRPSRMAHLPRSPTRCTSTLRVPAGTTDGLPLAPKRGIQEPKKAIAQLEARKKAVDESSLRRAGLSSYGGSSSRGNEYLAKKRQSRMAHLTEQEYIEAAKVLDFGSMTVDTRGNVVPRTPQAVVTAATMYLLNNQPPAGDPRTAMHRSTIVGLGLIEAALDNEPVLDPKIFLGG